MKKFIRKSPILAIVGLLHTSKDLYKNVLINNDSINPAERSSFEWDIKRKTMQRSAISWFITGYLIYTMASYRRLWFKLTTRVAKNILNIVLFTYVKFVMLLDLEER